MKSYVSYLSIGLALTIVACNDLTGSLTLQRALNVVDKKGNKITLSAGTRDAKLQYKADKREIGLKLKGAEGETQLKIVVPANVELPRETGDVVLKGSDIGQEFDLSGRLSTETVTSEKTRTNEYCTWTTREWDCRRVWRGGGGRGRGGRGGGGHWHEHCGYYSVGHTGTRDVEYHYVTTGVSLNANLTQSEEVVGQLAVARTTSQSKIYDYRGSCQ